MTDPIPAESEPALLLHCFGETLPLLTEHACLNAHHQRAACTACADLCPAEAIHLVQAIPELQPESCIGCGLCLAGCPTDAWQQPAPPEATLVAVAQGLPNAPLTLVCGLHPQPDSAPAPGGIVVWHRRCLASLSLGDLLALCRTGARPIYLDDTPCAACPLQAGAVIQHRLGLANDLLIAYARPAALAPLTTLKQPLPAPHPVDVIDGGQPRISRRRFLDALRRVLPTVAQTARERLLAALPQVNERAALLLPPNAPFAGVTVNAERCSGCGLCARFCPTDALTWNVEETAHSGTAFALEFVTARCVDCPVCTLACPENAIELNHAVPAAALLPTALPTRLIEGRLVPCRGCGMPTAATTPRPRCHVCRQSVGAVTPLHDGAGLMADLLQRSAHLASGSQAPRAPASDTPSISATQTTQESSHE